MRWHLASGILVMCACHSLNDPSVPDSAEGLPAPSESNTAGEAPVVPGPLTGPQVQKLTASAAVTVSRVPEDAQTLEALRSMELTLVLPNGVGTLPVVLELETPTGTPYQRIERALGLRPEDPQGTFTVPVAGSLIGRARLSGAWKVRCFLHGQEFAATTFMLP